MPSFLEENKIEKKDLLIPISILVGSILISLSIYCGLTGSTLGTLGLGATGSGAAGGGGSSEKVSITERKDAPTIGSGKIEIVEFSDFQCPFCQQLFNNAYKEIKAKYIDTGKAKFVYRHFPLPIHQNAQKAAEAAECANRQGKFEIYHDTLFTKGKADGTGLNISDLKQYARELGLDTTRFNSCLDGGETAEIVKADLAEGQKVGVSGTPTIFIDGQKVIGALPFADFEKVIEKALK